MFWWVFAGFGGCLVFFPFCDLEKAGCFGGFLLGLVVVWFSFLFVTWKKQGVLLGCFGGCFLPFFWFGGVV